MNQQLKLASLFVAFVFMINANGFFVFKHLCKTENIANYSIISSPSCEKQNDTENCCKEKANTNDDCCEHSLSFKKFSYNGFTSDVLKLKKLDLKHNFTFFSYNIYTTSKLFRVYFQGLSPPYPNYKIKEHLQPSRIALQSFLC